MLVLAQVSKPPRPVEHELVATTTPVLVVVVGWMRVLVLAQVTKPPSPVEHELVATTIPVLVEVWIVLPMIPPEQIIVPPRTVEQEVTVVVLRTVVVVTLLSDVTDVADPPNPPRVPLSPAPAVAPAPAPPVADTSILIPEDPVLTPTPTLAATDADKLAPREPWTLTMVLMDGPLTPAPALTPPAPAPVTEATRHAFRGSPPFVQVSTGGLFVVTLVAPITADVMPFVFTENVALMDVDTGGSEVVLLPTPFVLVERLVDPRVDGRVTEPAVWTLVLKAVVAEEPDGREVETPPPFTLVEPVLRPPPRFVFVETVGLVATGKALVG